MSLGHHNSHNRVSYRYLYTQMYIHKCIYIYNSPFIPAECMITHTFAWVNRGAA